MLNFYCRPTTVKDALRMIATSGFHAALECTKFVFGRNSAPGPAGRAYNAPLDPYSWFKGTLLLRKREERGGEMDCPHANSWIRPLLATGSRPRQTGCDTVIIKHMLVFREYSLRPGDIKHPVSTVLYSLRLPALAASV